MEKLYNEKTSRTPEIDFSVGKLRIWGTFVPENPAEFYLPLHEWLKEYSIAPARETNVDVGILFTRGFAMSYIQKLLQELIMFNDEQHHVIINWYYCMNSISVKAGKYLSRKLNYPFNFVEVEEIW